jgi:16S rRNA (guanine527-N7)-methyltransferase
MNQDSGSAGTSITLNHALSSAGLQALDAATAAKFDEYLALILRWNSRVNLTAIRDREEILSRHFVESIACARLLPPGIDSLLDLGSGAGFPGIPIALCRQGIAVTLAESQNKKAAFLQEAVRVLGLNARVFAGRAQELERQFDCVTLRAVDRMGEAVAAAASLVRADGLLAILTTREQIPLVQESAGPGFQWKDAEALPNSERRILALAWEQTE